MASTAAAHVQRRRARHLGGKGWRIALGSRVLASDKAGEIRGPPRVCANAYACLLRQPPAPDTGGFMANDSAYLVGTLCIVARRYAWSTVRYALARRGYNTCADI
eukprot:scaffold13599_cov140-Isochrysis_galbana.AAC.3